MDKREESRGHLDPPAAFGAPRPPGPRGLIPPSHFQSRSAPPLAASGAAPWRAGSPCWQPQELTDLRQENQRLRDELHRWAAEGTRAPRGRAGAETEEPGARTRSLDREAEPPAARHALAISQQAELISHQLHEIQRLEAELAGLQAAALQQEATVAARESTVACLQGELEQLRGRSRAEGEALRAELEEQKRRGQAEVTALKAELEELRRRGQAETHALRAELEEQRRRGQAEADALRAELEVAAEQHQQELAVARGELQAALEEGKAQTQRATERLQGALGEHQAELSRLCVAHGAEVGSLRQRALQLEQELEARGRARQSLQEQLSTAQAELASQQALLQQLRTYVGEQGSGLGPERQQLLGQVQRLEGERDSLRTTAELLQLRLASLSDILALQELELTRKPCDPLQPEPAQKSQSLLSRWREKVFALMVQLKSQELGHVDATNLLQRKVSELQGEVESRDQKVALLLHSLQDKTAEANMERVNNKTLRAELSHREDSGQLLQRRAEAAEGALRGLVEIVRRYHWGALCHNLDCSLILPFWGRRPGGWEAKCVIGQDVEVMPSDPRSCPVHRLHQQVGGQEAELKAAASNLAGLGNRVTFAAKRVDTIQGLVSRKVALARLQRDEQPKAAGSENDGPSHEALRAELALLHQERDRLVAELKKGAQILKQQVAEAREKAELELREATWSLQGALGQKEAAERERERRQQQGQLEGAQRELRESLEEAEGLRRELAGLRPEYERALQEKVTEVETRLRQDLSELEQRLSEARREQTKAVVALRQAERRAARDRARSQELARLQEEAKREETGRLGTRLQALERDKNLLMATLRQEGLLAQYKWNRLAAQRDPGEPVGTGQQPPLGKGGARPPSKGTDLPPAPRRDPTQRPPTQVPPAWAMAHPEFPCSWAVAPPAFPSFLPGFPPRRGYGPLTLTCYDLPHADLPSETLATVLDDLQSLSTALLREEDEETPPGEEGSAEDEMGPP
ncbi:coiled-coil alpha-helical rod protein 1 [Terrapene carolina triunguis]|uniref:coiled-coil alpha-helical rod protein 1 n=1 Tax=Terrapene triunguis TaxID=2587831 RepID=UPI0011563F33|nr:coiled-coil alpha-helical rod protein 1 [Terrapene carolina triunguis]